MSKRDYYEVLGLGRDVQPEEIKSAYRKLALKYHPDRNPGNKEAEELFKEASEAYEVLSTPEKRATYDRYGHQGLGSQGFSGFHDVNDIFSSFGSIFEDFFGFSSPGSRRGGRARRGADLRYDLRLEFEEAIFGVEKEIKFERMATCKDCNGQRAKPGTSPKQCTMCDGMGQVRRSQGFFSVATTCPTCSGEGTIVTDPCTGCKGRGYKMEKRSVNVKVPAGVESGIRLRMTGEGETGGSGGTPGDLYVVLSVEDSERFERDGNDLILRQPINIAQAALGCQLKVQTLENEKTITVPAGTQFGHRITIAGAGVPNLKGMGRGDLHVELHVVIPKKLTKEQKELLQKFAEISGDGAGGSGGFFGKLFDR